MISLEALLCYNTSTILKGEVNAKDFIVEEFDCDEGLWETFVDKIQQIYDDKDDNFIDWLNCHNLSNYIVDIKEDEAIVDETGGDYVILSVPFSFDNEKAFEDFTVDKNINR